jgi:hypothetical protein
MICTIHEVNDDTKVLLIGNESNKLIISVTGGISSNCIRCVFLDILMTDKVSAKYL